ncbi:MAG: GHKL domain-containing protein [Clostridiales bacterium]|nr:GHKL domain-containing protein [Clostridiales bacterium]
MMVYVGALGLFFLLAMLLSSHALRPAEIAWAQQQRFVSDASHELKTPLTVILANLDILESEQGGSQWLSAARAEGLIMKKLIENLLFLAHADETREIAEHDFVNLSNIVDEISLAFEAPAYEKGLTLNTDIAADQMMRGNADLLRQLLSILLDNAVKYTPEGGTIKVTLKKNMEKLALTVHNSGVHIPQEHLNHLFDRFYRMDPARSNAEGGHGLGLSIAAEIARQHGATLKAFSKPREGTGFCLLCQSSL